MKKAPQPAKTKKIAKGPQPTQAQFDALQSLYDYFNEKLFQGALPACILNLSRKSKAMGFFAPNRWAAQDQVKEGEIQEGAAALHEISLNPDFIAISHRETANTLVHEMCHLQRQIAPAKPPRGGYHCEMWAGMMLAVGLKPWAINNPEKMTGQKVSDTPIDGGPFDLAFQAMPADLLLPFSHIAVREKAKKESKASKKVKYTCGQCEANVWGKPELNVLCGDCEDEDGRPEKMLAEGEEKPERFLDGNEDEDEE